MCIRDSFATYPHSRMIRLYVHIDARAADGRIRADHRDVAETKATVRTFRYTRRRIGYSRLMAEQAPRSPEAGLTRIPSTAGEFHEPSRSTPNGQRFRQELAQAACLCGDLPFAGDTDDGVVGRHTGRGTGRASGGHIVRRGPCRQLRAGLYRR